MKETAVIEKEKVISPCGLYDLSALNEKEMLYWMFMYPRSGVLYLTSEPGIAKSATLRGIALKVIYIPTNQHLGYVDLRLAMLDETDVGLFPDKITIDIKDEETGEMRPQTFLYHITPYWAHQANETPTIIHFEELNRAPQAVRNAALQILLEREIGANFKFKKTVFMCSTGNLGDEDGTDVEEFDEALNGRLIHYRHTLTIDEWIEYFANEHVHPAIVNFIRNKPANYYVGFKSRGENDKIYASPRTWTFLSEFITKNFGKFGADGVQAYPSIESWLPTIQVVANSFVGSASFDFVRYLNDTLKISIQDILNRYTSLKKEGVKFNRDKKAQLLRDLREIDIESLKKNNIQHIKAFLLDIHPDEASAYLLWLLDNKYVLDEDDEADDLNNAFILGFLQDPKFKDFQAKMMANIQNKI